MPLQPCPGGSWEASLDLGATPLVGAACVASVVEGTRQPPFQLGLSDPAQPMSAHTLSASCPPTLRIDQISVASPAEVPNKELDVTIGDNRVHLRITAIASCEVGAPSLVCRNN
jgi:hypothetical protein